MPVNEMCWVTIRPDNGLIRITIDELGVVSTTMLDTPTEPDEVEPDEVEEVPPAEADEIEPHDDEADADDGDTLDA